MKSEEVKAIEWLNKKRQEHSLPSEELHYLQIIYYLIKNKYNINELGRLNNEENR